MCTVVCVYNVYNSVCVQCVQQCVCTMCTVVCVYNVYERVFIHQAVVTAQ